MRGWLWAFYGLCGFILLLSSGCDFAAKDDSDEDSIIFWHAMPGDLGATLDTIIERFNKDRTRFRVVPRFQGEYGQLKSKIAMSLTADSPPDIAQMYESWISYYNLEKGREALFPLNDLIQRDAKEVNLADIYDVYVRDNTFDGRIYSFPCNKSFPCLYYNKDMFAQAGLDPEKPPTTWDEFAAAGKKLTRDKNNSGKVNVWGWAFTEDPWIFDCMVLQNNGQLADGDADVKPLDNPQMLRALQFYNDAISGPKPWAYRTSGREFQNDFVAQRVAMIVTTCASKPFMIDQIAFRWGMAPIPYGPKKVSIMSGTNIGIFARCPPVKREVAWEFIKFFARTDITTFWALQTSYLPVRRSAVASRAFQDSLKIDPTPAAAVAQLENATFEPRAAEWVLIRDRLAQALRRCLVGQEAPLAALQRADRESRELEPRR